MSYGDPFDGFDSGTVKNLWREFLVRLGHLATSPERDAAFVAVLANLIGECIHRQPPPLRDDRPGILRMITSPHHAMHPAPFLDRYSGVRVVRFVLVQDALRPGDLTEPRPQLATEHADHGRPVAVDIAPADEFPGSGLVINRFFSITDSTRTANGFQLYLLVIRSAVRPLGRVPARCPPMAADF